MRIADNVSEIDRQRTVAKTTKLLKTLIKLVFELKIAPTSTNYLLDIPWIYKITYNILSQN